MASPALVHYTAILGIDRSVFEHSGAGLDPPLTSRPISSIVEHVTPHNRAHPPGVKEDKNDLRPSLLPPLAFPNGCWLNIESPTIASRNKTRTGSHLHSFIITVRNQDATCVYGHVLTRYYPMHDESHQAVLRMQIAADAMKQVVNDDSTYSISNVFQPADTAVEPQALVVLTFQPIHETMRYVLSTFDEWIGPNQRLSYAHAVLIYRVVAGGPAFRLSNENMTFSSAEDSHILLSDLKIPEEKILRNLKEAFPGPQKVCTTLQLPVEDKEAHNQLYQYAPNKLEYIRIPWIEDDNSNFAILPPTSCHYWELPQTSWRCNQCKEQFTGMSRSSVSHQNDKIPVEDVKIIENLRSVESNSCIKCVQKSQKISAPVAVGVIDKSSSSSRMSFFVEPPLEKNTEFAENKTDYSNSLKAIPWPFTLRSNSGLPPLDYDPRFLFSKVSPANIIALLTSLLCERNVLIISKDTSILPDVMSALLTLLHPFIWCGAFSPVMPSQYALMSFLQSPMPVFLGCHPSLAKAAALVDEEGGGQNEALQQYVSQGGERPWNGTDSSGAGTRWNVQNRISFEQFMKNHENKETVSSDFLVTDGSKNKVPLSFWKQYEHILALNGSLPYNQEQNTGEAPNRLSGFSKLVSAAAKSISSSLQTSMDVLVYAPTATLLESTWAGLGMDTELKEDDSRKESDVAMGAKHYQKSGKSIYGNDRAAACSVVVFDLDHDAISPNYVPPSHLLPSRLSTKLWNSILLHAPLYSWANPDSQCPPPLPDFPLDTTVPEIEAAESIYDEFAKRAESRGWDGLSAVSSEDSENNDVESTKTQLFADSLFAPFKGKPFRPIIASMNKKVDENSNVNESEMTSTSGKSIVGMADGTSKMDDEEENYDEEDEEEDSLGISSKISASSRRLTFSSRTLSGSNRNFSQAGSSKAPVASIRTLNQIHSDEEDDDEDEEMENVSRSFSNQIANRRRKMMHKTQSLDCRPIVVSAPWELWRNRLRLQQSLNSDYFHLSISASHDGRSNSSDRYSIEVREPPLHFAKLRIEAMKVMVSLFKAYRVYMHAEAVQEMQIVIDSDSASEKTDAHHSDKPDTTRIKEVASSDDLGSSVPRARGSSSSIISHVLDELELDNLNEAEINSQTKESVASTSVVNVAKPSSSSTAIFSLPSIARRLMRKSVNSEIAGSSSDLSARSGKDILQSSKKKRLTSDVSRTPVPFIRSVGSQRNFLWNVQNAQLGQTSSMEETQTGNPQTGRFQTPASSFSRNSISSADFDNPESRFNRATSLTYSIPEETFPGLSLSFSSASVSDHVSSAASFENQLTGSFPPLENILEETLTSKDDSHSAPIVASSIVASTSQVSLEGSSSSVSQEVSIKESPDRQSDSISPTKSLKKYASIFKPPRYEDAFNVEEFLAEETPPDSEPLITHITKATQLFAVFVQDRCLASGSGLVSSSDLFDRLCWQKMYLRSWRHSNLRTRSTSGQLFKAIRGTLCKSWERRYFELNSNILAYYSNAVKIEELKNKVMYLKVVAASSGRNLLVADEKSMSDGNGSTDPKAELKAAELSLEKLMASSYKRSFYLVSGRTEVVIPSSTMALFPTAYVFQLVNPSIREMRQRILSKQSSDSFDTTSSNAQLAGNDRDVLTLCADSAAERRDWILFLKARVRPEGYVNVLKSAYLVDATKYDDDGDQAIPSPTKENSGDHLDDNYDAHVAARASLMLAYNKLMEQPSD
jgi:DENN (AEX-3) domain